MGVRTEHIRHSKRITRGARWQSLRLAVLERDGWACVTCGEQRRLEVDHIQPVRTHPQLAYLPGNLQALCGPCHTKKTRIECGHPAIIKTPEQNAWGIAVAELAAKKPTKHTGESYA